MAMYEQAMKNDLELDLSRGFENENDCEMGSVDPVDRQLKQLLDTHLF